MALLLESVAVELAGAAAGESVDVDDANGRTIQRDLACEEPLHKLSQCRMMMVCSRRKDGERRFDSVWRR
jgi:hypothetical protein